MIPLAPATMLKIHFTSPDNHWWLHHIRLFPFLFFFFLSKEWTWWGSALWENSPGHPPAPEGHFAAGVLFFGTKGKLMCLTNKGEEKESGWGEKASGLMKRGFFSSNFKCYHLSSEVVLCFTVCRKAASRLLLLCHSFLIKSLCYSKHVSLSLSALIICRSRSWAEGSAGPPTLIRRAHVLYVSSPLVLRSRFATNDPTKHLNDKEHKLPAVLWAAANRQASQTQKTLEKNGKKKEKKRRTNQCQRTASTKTRRGDFAVLKGSEESSRPLDLGFWWTPRWEPIQDANNLQISRICLFVLYF